MVRALSVYQTIPLIMISFAQVELSIFIRERMEFYLKRLEFSFGKWTKTFSKEGIMITLKPKKFLTRDLRLELQHSCHLMEKFTALVVLIA